MGSTWGHIDIECLIYAQSIKMKFVVAFLACIVAAQAATFSCPSYEYWCAHSFHVLPRSHYYCYRFHFNHAWCTGAYYRDILVEFPQRHIPKGCEAEDQAEARVQEMIRKLGEARDQIINELMMPQGNWIKNLCDMHDERCKAYSAELDALKEQAIRRYNEQVRSFMMRIEHFHSQIIAQFRQCLATRKTRVYSFHTKLYHRADRYVACYKEQLEKLRLRKIAFVRNIFTCIYAGK